MSKILIALGAAFLVLALVPAAALAGKGGPGKGGGAQASTVAPLGLTSEWVHLNPNAPSWCLAEDDIDQRAFNGSLAGSYTTGYQLCGSSDYYNGVWWNAGGIGLESDVYVVGQLSDLVITAPDGTVRHAVLMGQSTSKGVTTSHYTVCEAPPYSISTDVAGTSLVGGTWQLTLSGQISSASWTTNAEMTDATFQQAYCPPSEQNLVS